jgi:hypothetical protein
MKRLLITLLLVSPLSFADWGDVYYCQETIFVMTSPNGKLREGELEKFQFKLDKAKNAMVFGSSGLLAEEVIRLRKGSKLGGEQWFAENNIDRVSFSDGEFLYTLTSRSTAFMMSADCDKF